MNVFAATQGPFWQGVGLFGFLFLFFALGIALFFFSYRQWATQQRKHREQTEFYIEHVERHRQLAETTEKQLTRIADALDRIAKELGDSESGKHN